MISIDCLRAVKRIIVHMQTADTPCADGRASALIAHAALPDAPIVEMAYGSPEHEALAVEPGMLFLDFSPPKTRLLDFVCAGGAAGYAAGEPGAIVLDHHGPELVEPFGELGIFGDNEKVESGAMLALTHVLGPLHEVRFGDLTQEAFARAAARKIASLAAIRDTWQRSSPRWDDACAMSAALVFPPLDDLLAMDVVRFAEMARDLGPMLLAKRREEVAQAAATAVKMTIAGHRVAVIPSLTLTSDVAELLAAEADITAGFAYVHEAAVRLQFSLRSRGAVDVQAIARYHGGGGHKAAAGFARPVDTSPRALAASPYASLRFLLAEALAAPRATP
jgi:hypothetical protein